MRPATKFDALKSNYQYAFFSHTDFIRRPERERRNSLFIGELYGCEIWMPKPYTIDLRPTGGMMGEVYGVQISNWPQHAKWPPQK